MKRKLLAVVLSMVMTIVAVAPAGAGEVFEADAFESVAEYEDVASEEEAAEVFAMEETTSAIPALEEDADGEASGEGWSIVSGTLTVTTQNAMKKHEWTEDEVTRLSVKKTVIGEGIETISNSAFKDCIAMTEVSIPQSVISTETAVFSHCTSLNKINFAPESKLTIIGDQTFSGCERVKEINLPKNLTKIGSSAFCGTSLTAIIIPDAVTEIGSSAFYQLGTLETVKLSANLSKMGKKAFGECIAIKSIDIPGSLVEIPEDAFKKCTGLETVNFGEGIIKIMDGAFKDCTSLKSVLIPASVTEIHGSYEPYLGMWTNGAFDSCTSLEKIEFAENSNLMVLYPLSFAYCPAESIRLPEKLTMIKECAFELCGFKEVYIPDSVVTIGELAFNGCNDLEKLTIGNGVVEIGKNAFRCGKERYNYDSDGDGLLDSRQMVLVTDNKVAKEYDWLSVGRCIVDKITVRDEKKSDDSSSGKNKDSSSGKNKNADTSKSEQVDLEKEKEWKEYVSTVSVDKAIKSESDVLIVGERVSVDISNVYLTQIMAKGKAGSYDKGILTALKKGTVKLYTIVGGKKKVVCKIKVEAPKMKPSVSVKVGKSKKAKIKGTKQATTYTTSNKKVAAVSPDGTVTGISPGTATITAAIGSHTYTTTVVVQ